MTGRDGLAYAAHEQTSALKEGEGPSTSGMLFSKLKASMRERPFATLQDFAAK